MVYADPPYTKDQYSRYYHVYETLYLYDFPDSSGEGPARGDRFSTGFPVKSRVAETFTELFDAIANLKVPLVLSYPSNGLLVQAGSSVEALLGERFSLESHETFAAEHSTMGAHMAWNPDASDEEIAAWTSSTPLFDMAKLIFPSFLSRRRRRCR